MRVGYDSTGAIVVVTPPGEGFTIRAEHVHLILNVINDARAVSLRGGPS
jgi:hypothetical protein